ncbi:MAG: cbb3-type cytochrome c oxidase subunit I [Pirellulaceae bacterium]|nr:cbb3-type cytochrome c oxidase subunit I [Pirellulaceae bacterium]
MNDASSHGDKQSFLWRYVFSRDHKVIGTQFLFSTLIWFAAGGILAIALRIQLAWPWTSMPYFGNELFATEGGQISPDFYNMLFTMHASIMIFFVIIPILAGAFGNILIPLMIGADDMAFPTLNMLSYWVMWPAFIFMGLSFGTPTFGPGFGWTANPPMTEGPALTFWLLALICVGISSMMGSVNYLTTIIQMRAPGMTMFRLPMTIWGMFVTAILQAFALPVLTAALSMQLADNVLGTGFFRPESAASSGGGEPLMWQHLFWFYSHPAVYIMILPAMGMVSDIISCFARKPLFGYKPMIYSISGIAGLGFIVWGHHMFISGMNPWLGTTFALSTILIALPSAVKVFNWLGTLWNGNLQLTSPMLFAISFVSMFIIGGLSGIPIASPLIDIPLHDTYFIVAHIHYVLFAGTVMGVFAGIYFWYPKLFGRMMNETLGKIHFLLTFVSLNATFFLMHVLGWMGVPRRYASFQSLKQQIDEGAQQLELAASNGVDKIFVMAKDYDAIVWINEFITYSAIVLGIVQVFFVVNFFGSLLWGKRAGRNPWNANTLEWTTPSPPGHGNFDFQPTVHRGPYEYSHPESEKDFLLQTDPPLAPPHPDEETATFVDPTGSMPAGENK